MPIADVVTNFNAIMVSVEEKVMAEHDDQRITGPDYASVYLGAIQAALQTALGYETQGKTAEAEIALLAQKKYSEEAQIRNRVGIGFLEDPNGTTGNTDGLVVYDIGPGNFEPGAVGVTKPTGGGVMGKQQVLYNKQTDGFDRDAEQKLVKIMNDLYSIKMSVSDVAIDLPSENNELGLDETIKFAKDNLGIV